MARSVTKFHPESLRAYRQAAGLSQVELAARLGTSSGNVSQWETGLHSPSVRALIAVARELDVDPLELTTLSTAELAGLRIRAGFTRTQVAEAAGLALEPYTALERGEAAELSPTTAERLADVFRVDPDDVTAAYRRAGTRRETPAASPMNLMSHSQPQPPQFRRRVRRRRGDRVVIVLPDRQEHPRRVSREVAVTGTVTEVDLPGLPPGVRIALDRPVAGADTCYAAHHETRAANSPMPTGFRDRRNTHTSQPDGPRP